MGAIEGYPMIPFLDGNGGERLRNYPGIFLILTVVLIKFDQNAHRPVRDITELPGTIADQFKTVTAERECYPVKPKSLIVKRQCRKKLV
ncbi:MAG: hypothetical protein ACE5K3_05960 [bacterium]